MKTKIKIKIALAIIIVIVASIITSLIIYFNLNKKTEIVWYLAFPNEYGFDLNNLKEYEPLEAERFDLFNKRLEELGIPAKVVFKYKNILSDYREINEKKDMFLSRVGMYKNNIVQVENLLKNDKDADIFHFHDYEYDKFIPLDDCKDMNKINDVIPDKILRHHKINGKLYQIPRGVIPTARVCYSFNKQFLDAYNIKLDEEKIKTMTIKEVVDYLLPYFEKDRLLNGKYFLTDSYGISNYYQSFQDKISLLRSNFMLWLDLNSKKVENPIETKEFRDYLDFAQYIYQNNIDAHTDPKAHQGGTIRVFSVGYLDTYNALAYKESENETISKGVYIDENIMLTSLGNGVLKESDNKDLAVEVLMASMYDEELSNIMIYGVPDKDYELKDGRAIYKDREVMSFAGGSLSEIGNNFIAYPNEFDYLDKKEKSMQLLNEIKIIPLTSFTPLWDDELYDKMAKVAVIYGDLLSDVNSKEINDMDKFINEYKQKLNDAGVDELVAELQKQVDNWVE